MVISMLLLLLTQSHWMAGVATAANSKLGLQLSLQQQIGRGKGIRQFGLAYRFKHHWSLGAHANYGQFGEEAAYGVNKGSVHGAGFSSAFYRSGYDVDSYLFKGRLGLQTVDISEKGYQVGGENSLTFAQMDLDFLGGYQFIWGQQFVFDIQAGLRKSFLDVAYNEYVFSDEAYNLKVFRAADIESTHFLMEFGVGVII